MFRRAATEDKAPIVIKCHASSAKRKQYKLLQEQLATVSPANSTQQRNQFVGSKLTQSVHILVYPVVLVANDCRMQ